MPLALKEIEGIEELMEIREDVPWRKGVFYFPHKPNVGVESSGLF